MTRFLLPRNPLSSAHRATNYFPVWVLAEWALFTKLVKKRSIERFAIKIIRDSRFASPKQIARFQIEAAALAEIEHPNIVTVYDVGSFENRPFLVFEYVNAGNLAERIQRKPQAISTAARYVRDLANAVQAAHDRGIVHRDLKPANILLHDKSDFATIELENLVPKITDFGIAKRIDDSHDLTISGEIIGSPDYMSPEQAAGGHRTNRPNHRCLFSWCDSI